MGDHWFAVNSGLGDLSVTGLAMDPGNYSVLYACGPSGVYKTLTGGEVESASIAISAVVNGASNLLGPVSPGEIVVITGSGLGPGQLIPATPGANGLYSVQLSGTRVRRRLVVPDHQGAGATNSPAGRQSRLRRANRQGDRQFPQRRSNLSTRYRLSRC